MSSNENVADDGMITVTGVIQFYWDSGDEVRHLLVNIEPDNIHLPDAWELTGILRDAAISEIEEGGRIEIDYVVEHHEIVDPDAATTIDSHRPRILSVRIPNRD